MDLQVGVIGAGNIATRHLANLDFLDGNRVAGICDLEVDRAEELANQYGANAYSGFEDLIEQESDLDAVVICTPPTVRRSIFELAAERGIAVYCEKPPADTVEEAQDIAQLVEEREMTCSVGFHMRYSPAVDLFRDLTEGRTFNFVRSISAGSLALSRSLDGWFYIKEKSGGHVMDQAIHFIDLMRFVVGDITHVQTFGNNVVCPKDEVFTIEDTTCTNIRFANGASGSHIHSWSVPKGMNDLTITGADFSLSLTAHSPPRVSGMVGGFKATQDPVNKVFEQGPAMGRGGKISEKRGPEDPPDPPHCGSLAAFLEAVRSGDKRLIRSPYRDAVRSLAAVLAMNRSIDTGQVEEV